MYARKMSPNAIQTRNMALIWCAVKNAIIGTMLNKLTITNNHVYFAEEDSTY